MPPLPRGRCPECGAEVALRKGGLVREHRDRSTTRELCSGSGERARAILNISVEERQCMKDVELYAAKLEDALKWLEENGTQERGRELVELVLHSTGPYSFEDLVGFTIQLGAIAEGEGEVVVV